MRAALSGLTTRGRCFLAAGVAAALCALVLGEEDLLRVAALLVALPLVAVGVVSRTRYRLRCVRHMEPARVPVGAPARVVLTLENVSRLPSGVLLMEDRLPYTLGGRPRFVLDRVEPRGIRHVGYPVRSDVRGKYTIGPLTVRLTDPFGLCELTRSFASVDHLVVTPHVVPLPPARVGGDWVGGGESSARSVSTHGEDDAATREYRHGDDLRKVHWRSTARTGELMVRREEQPWQSRAAVLLDTRAPAHRGDGPGSSFEWSVSAAASVAVHLARAGYAMRLVNDTGTDLVAGHGTGAEGAMLDALAEVGPSRSRTLAPALDTLRRAGSEGLVVAVLGTLAPEEAERLSRLRVGNAPCVAVLVDSAGWIGAAGRPREESRDAYESAGRLLRAGGWRVVEIRHGDDLAAAWPQAMARSNALTAQVR